MLLITHERHDPAFNLACEEYFLTKTTEEVFMLWRNGPSVIVGRNQNTLAEVDAGFTERHGITVMRRQTGGGAVFHDLGNINYSHIADHAGPIDLARFCRPMVALLRGMGVDARLTGRNDIEADGAKISGNAQTVRGGRVLHHGTLLYSADLSRMGGALRVRDDKYRGRAVTSVASRVRNLASILPNAPHVEVFLARLFAALPDVFPGAEVYTLTLADLEGIEEIMAGKYLRPDWTFGMAGGCTFTGSVRRPAGGVEVRLALCDGVIESAEIYGDFFGVEDVSELTAALRGLPHRPDVLEALLTSETCEKYFSGFSREDLIEAFL